MITAATSVPGYTAHAQDDGEGAADILAAGERIDRIDDDQRGAGAAVIIAIPNA